MSTVDYLAVRNAIKSIIKNPEWDDGSLGPVLVRYHSLLTKVGLACLWNLLQKRPNRWIQRRYNALQTREH